MIAIRTLFLSALAVLAQMFVAPLVLAQQAPREAAWAGITVETLTPEKVAKYGLLVDEGVRVTAIDPDGPAAALELKVGDVITRIDQHKIKIDQDFQAALADRAAGDKVDVIRTRAGDQSIRKVAVTLVPRPRGYMGADLVALSQEDAAALGIAAGIRLSPRAGLPADAAGVRNGDVAIAMDGDRKAVTSVDAFVAAIGSRGPGAVAVLGVLRDGSPMDVAVTLGRRPAEPGPKLPEPVLTLDTGGHMALINGLTFTGDGRQLVSASDDKVVRVWDPATGKTVRVLRGDIFAGDEGKAYTQALSPVDNSSAGHRLLAVAGWIKGPGGSGFGIRLYDLVTGRLERVLTGHTNVIFGLAFSPDGRKLISGGYDKTAIVWDVESGRQLHLLEGHKAEVYGVGFSIDGARVVTVSFDRTVRLWEAATGKLIKSMTGHQDKVRSLAINPRDGMIATGAWDGEIRLWDGKTGQFLRTLARQGTLVGAMAFTPDGMKLLSTCGQGHPCNDHVWDVATGRELASHKIDDDIVPAAAIAPDGQLAATGGGANQEIHVWDLATGTRRKGADGQPLTLAGTGRSKWAAGFSVDGRSIGWGSHWTRNDPANGYGRLEFQLRLPTGTQSMTQPEPIGAADATNPARWRLAVPARDGVSLVHRKGGPFGYDIFLDVRRNGETLVTIERDSTDGYANRSYSLTPDGASIVSGGNNGKIVAYGLDGRKLGSFVGHEGDMWAVTPSPDGRFLVSGSADQTVRLWNLKTFELIVTLFHGTDGEWVMWTPQGYFTGSANAGDIVGWQINHGADKEASYVKGDQLRHFLRRPDIVERAIVLADAAKAVAEFVGSGPSLAELVNRPPPSLFVGGNSATGTGRVTLVIEVERTGRAVKDYEVHLGGDDERGRFKAERKLPHKVVPVPANYQKLYPDRDLVAVEVGLRQGENRLGVRAITDVGEGAFAYRTVRSGNDALGGAKGTLRILAIGVDDYPSAPGVAKLAFAGKDARAFVDATVRAMGSHFAAVAQELLVSGAGGAREPTKANIEAALQRLPGPKDSQSGNDVVLLFVASHGEQRRYAAGQGTYAVLPADFKRRDLADPGSGDVPWQTFADALSSASGQKAVFLDTCYSANAYNTSLEGDAQGIKFSGFAASSPDGLAYADSTGGYFTKAAVAGLNGQALPRDSTDIRVDDLGAYLRRSLPILSGGKQTAEYFPRGPNFVLTTVGQTTK